MKPVVLGSRVLVPCGSQGHPSGSDFWWVVTCGIGSSKSGLTNDKSTRYTGADVTGADFWNWSGRRVSVGEFASQPGVPWALGLRLKVRQQAVRLKAQGVGGKILE